jgi:hypothetical protein
MRFSRSSTPLEARPWSGDTPPVLRLSSVPALCSPGATSERFAPGSLQSSPSGAEGTNRGPPRSTEAGAALSLAVGRGHQPGERGQTHAECPSEESDPAGAGLFRPMPRPAR